MYLNAKKKILSVMKEKSLLLKKNPDKNGKPKEQPSSSKQSPEKEDIDDLIFLTEKANSST